MKTNYTIKNFAKRVMMAITIVLFAGNAWGYTTGTLPMNTSVSTGYTSNTVTFTWSSANIAINAGNSSGFKANSSMTVTIPAGKTLIGISKENGNSWGSGATIKVYAGSNNSGTEIASIVSGTNSYDIDENNTGTTYFLENSTSKNAWIKSISFIYAEPYTVSFDAEAGACATTSLKEASTFDGVELPSATLSSDLVSAGWKFAGWATEAVSTETMVSPLMYSAGDTYYPKQDITLHAVYRKETDGTSTSTAEFPYGKSGLTTLASNSYTSWWWQHTASGIEFYIEYYGIHSSAFNIDNSGDNSGDGWGLIDAHRRIKQVVMTLKAAANSIATVTPNTGTANLSTSGTTQTITCTGDVTSMTIEPNTTNNEAYITTFTVTYYNTKFNSNPCSHIVDLSAGTETNATISSFSDAGVQTCSSIAADRQVTITVAAATGYEFLSTARLTFAKTSGTATAEYVSGPTGTGPYTWVYQFSKDDSGAGTFSVTSATPKSYIITLNGNGATTEGTANVTATYNSATLSASITNPKKTHYMFQGWYSGSGGTGNLVINKDGELQANVAGYTGEGGVWTKDGATTLYAKWTEHSYTNYRTKCCDDPGLAFDGEYNYQTLVREDIIGAHGPDHNAEGNPVATVEQGLATLVLKYSTSSTGTCTVEVKKLTGGDKRSTAAAGSDCSNHTSIAVDGTNKKVTFEIWTYAPSYPTANGQGTYRIKLSQATASTYCATDVYYFVDVTLRDKFVDAVNGNSTINVDGQSKSTTDYYQTPEESDLTETNDCDGTNRRLRGWISEMDLKSQYGTPGETGYLNDAAGYNSSKVVAPDADIITSGCTWYAVWGVEK